MRNHTWKKRLLGITSQFWTYLSGVSALALMLGVLGMGIYHSLKDSLELGHEEYYAGFVNKADESLPQGINPLESEANFAASSIRFAYDEAGKLFSILHLNAAGMRSGIPGSRVAEQKLIYDDAGRLIAKENVDVYGAAVPDAAGVSSRRFSYNDEGLLVECAFFNERGEAVVPRMPGYAIKKIQYDEQRRPILVEHFDGKYQPIVNADNEGVIRLEYSSDGRTRTRHNEIKGALANNKYGYATERLMKSNGHQCQRQEWYDAEGAAVINRRCGAAIAQHDRGSSPESSERRVYLDEHAQPIAHERTPYEHLVRRNETGQIEWECFNAADGLPCVNDLLAYAERVCEYGENEHLQREFLWDELGNCAPCYERRYTPTGTGDQVISLNTDGSTLTEYVAGR